MDINNTIKNLLRDARVIYGKFLWRKDDPGQGWNDCKDDYLDQVEDLLPEILNYIKEKKVAADLN